MFRHFLPRAWMKIIVGLSPLLFAGCISMKVPIPAGYEGGLATIDDTFVRHGQGSADFFVVVDGGGQTLWNATNQSGGASGGEGNRLSLRGYRRTFPAGQQRLSIMAYRYFVVPIIQMVREEHKVLAQIDADLKPGQFYVVRGVIEDEYIAVWLEDSTGRRMSVVSEAGEPQRDTARTNRNDAPDAGADDPGARAVRFHTIAHGIFAETIVARLGEPNAITEVPDEGPGLFSDYVPGYMEYRYESLGTVRFRHTRVNGEKAWFVERAMFERAGDHLDAIGVAQVGGLEASAEVDRRLRAADPTSLRAQAREYHEVGPNDASLYEVFAQLIWDLRDSDDDEVIDAAAFFCRIIGDARNPRYRTLMQRLDKESTSGKLRRYARNTLDQLPEAPAEQFDPT